MEKMKASSEHEFRKDDINFETKEAMDLYEDTKESRESLQMFFGKVKDLLNNLNTKNEESFYQDAIRELGKKEGLTVNAVFDAQTYNGDGTEAWLNVVIQSIKKDDKSSKKMDAVVDLVGRTGFGLKGGQGSSPLMIRIKLDRKMIENMIESSKFVDNLGPEEGDDWQTYEHVENMKTFVEQSDDETKLKQEYPFDKREEYYKILKEKKNHSIYGKRRW